MIKNLLTILLLCFAITGWSQSNSAQQKKLEQKKAQLQKEIKQFQELLSKENKKEKSVLGQITENNAKIRLTQSLISTTSKQAKLLSDDIYLNQLKVNKLNRELEVLKADYSNTLIKSYKSRSQKSRIMFVLSSENFLQAYKRIQYMKQYASFRKIQGDEIKYKMDELAELNAKLNSQKKQKEKVVAETKKEQATLEKDKQEQEKLMKIIRKDKKKYAADIKKKRKQEQDIDRQIDKLIREAIAEANRKKAKAEGKSTKNVSSTKIELTKEGKIIADNFKANKGSLPWPVERGYISLGYGDQADPFDHTLKIHNSGILITSEEGASARAVFAGEVSDIQIVYGKLMVTVRHGNFLTVYMNLSSVTVKTGDQVQARQTLGKIKNIPSSGGTVLKFLIYQDNKYLNPQQWLSH